MEAYMLAAGVVLCALALGLTIRLIIGASNHRRIAEALEADGSQPLSIEWAPFGPGWFGTQNVIYLVRYRTEDGSEHQVYAQTAPFGKVYFREDESVSGPTRPPCEADPDRENRRLRDEVARLRKENERLRRRDEF